jgi:DNA-binding IclR family transcriptional regulator
MTEANGGVAALDRAFAILNAFVAMRRPLSLAEIAKQTGLYKSTILRLLGSLGQHHMVERLEDGRYRLGYGAYQLGAAYQRMIAPSEILMPILRDLADMTSESVAFYVRSGDQRTCLYRVESKHPIRYMVREGDLLSLSTGSGGRVVAAFSGAGGEPYDSIRKRGTYSSIGERDPETAGVSAPVFGPLNAFIGAITLAGPRTRVDEEFLKRFQRPLIEAAARATRAFGGDADRYL